MKKTLIAAWFVMSQLVHQSKYNIMVVPKVKLHESCFFRVNHSRKGDKGMINVIVHVLEEYIMYFSCPWPFAYTYYNNNL